jgi:hypothetical protein
MVDTRDLNEFQHAQPGKERPPHRISVLPLTFHFLIPFPVSLAVHLNVVDLLS